MITFQQNRINLPPPAHTPHRRAQQHGEAAGVDAGGPRGWHRLGFFTFKEHYEGEGRYREGGDHPIR